MPEAWEPLYEQIKGQFLAQVKAEVAEIDWSGSVFQDVNEVFKAGRDILRIFTVYVNQFDGLEPKDRRSMFAKGFDEALKLPVWLEPWDDNAGAMIYDLFVA